jgi:hypothetical protein
MTANAQTWEDLEVRKRTLNFGSAGVLDAPEDVDFPPNAEGKASIRFRVSSRKETPLKGDAVEITMILTITKIEIDAKSIVVPIPDPKLPGMDGKRTGQTTMAGDAVQAVVDAIAAGAEVPPHQFVAGETAEGEDSSCLHCRLAKSSPCHQVEPAPEPPTPIGKKRAPRSGTMKATRRPRARG